MTWSLLHLDNSERQELRSFPLWRPGMLPHESDVAHLVHEEMPWRLVSRRRSRTGPVLLAGERPTDGGADRELRAVLAASRPALSDGVAVSTLYGLAVRGDVRRRGLALEGMRWLLEELVDVLRALEPRLAVAGLRVPDTLILTGIVHRDNEPSRALIRELGWEPEGSVGTDGYQRCRLVRALE